jgi:hypothetical protein
MSPQAFRLELTLRAQRYRGWHANPLICAATHFFAAASLVNSVLARWCPSAYLVELGGRLEGANVERGGAIAAGRLYRGGSITANTEDFVRFEQALVQEELEKLRSRSSARYTAEISLVNKALRTALSIGRPLVDRRFIAALENTTGGLGGRFDFADESSRTLLGIRIAQLAHTDS